MDALYYLSGFLAVLGLPVFGIGVILALIKPHLVNERSVVKNPFSRKKIATLGITTMLVSFVGFTGVMAATEPASVKADRLSRETIATKAAEQAKADAAKKASEAAAKREAELNKPVIKTESKTEAVAYGVSEQNDNTIPAGEKRIGTAGKNGARTITYEVTYVQSKETARKEIKNEITTPPVTQITLNGTYVKPAPAPAPQPSCPNGSYVNSAGNTVCSPYQSASSGAPAGATAQCADGSYSFSQSRRGTCSHHGGVASWL